MNFLGMAEAITQRRGKDALEAFGRTLILGAIREEGPERLEDLYAASMVALGKDVALTRVALLDPHNRYKWVFDERWVRSLENWMELEATCVVLVGLSEDVAFYVVDAGEFVSTLSDDGKVIRILGNPDLKRWERNWSDVLSESGTMRPW